MRINFRKFKLADLKKKPFISYPSERRHPLSESDPHKRSHPSLWPVGHICRKTFQQPFLIVHLGTESLALGLDSLTVGGGSLRETEGVIRLDDGTELPRPQHLGPISREGYAQLQVRDNANEHVSTC